MLHYQFLYTDNILLYANSTTIMNASLIVSRDANGVINNITFNHTAQYRNLTLTSFRVVGTYLIISCSTCDSNRGRI